MNKELLRNAWVEIDTSRIKENIKSIRSAVGDLPIFCPAIKADAYGHGAVQVAKTLKEIGINMYAVATVQEALELRYAGIYDDIVLLSLLPNELAPIAVEHNLIPFVASVESAHAISAEANCQGRTMRIVVAIDTGMGRIGFSAMSETAITDSVKSIAEISRLDNIEIFAMASHLSTADSADKTYSLEQIERFERMNDALKEAGTIIPRLSILNSAGTAELPQKHFDICRPGISIYGYYPSDECDKSLVNLTPAMSVKAEISFLKDVEDGMSIGYGRKFRACGKRKIATISLGYADGLPRPYNLKGDARVIIGEHFAPIAGNICMDQCMIDVTDIPNARLGTEVIIMGSSPGGLSITADDIANATDTISYEILCGFGQRLPKLYL